MSTSAIQGSALRNSAPTAASGIGSSAATTRSAPAASQTPLNAPSSGSGAPNGAAPKPVGLFDNLETLFSSSSDFGSIAGSITGIGQGIGAIAQGIGFFENADDMKPEDAAIGGATAGASIGTAVLPGWGTAIGGLVGGVVGAIKSLFGGGKKSKEHRERIAVRDWLRQNTPLGPNLQFQGFVGNGQVGVISLDGKSHKVDNSTGVLAQATGLTDVLATVLTGGNPRLTAEVSAMFLNAISGATVFSEALASVRSLMSQMNLTPEALARHMVAQYGKGMMTPEKLQEHLAYIDILAGNKPGPADEPVPADAVAPEEPAVAAAAMPEKPVIETKPYPMPRPVAVN